MRTPRLSFVFLALALALPAVAPGQVGNSDPLEFSGRADRTGDPTAEASLRWVAIFAGPDLDLDLSSGVTVALEGALTELDGIPLVSIADADLAGTPLVASRGARTDQAKFELPGANRSGTRVRISRRSGRIQITTQINRAEIATPAACLAGAPETTLRSTVSLQRAGAAAKTYAITRNWKCSPRRSCDGCFDLKSASKSGGTGPVGNRRPEASIRFENLTRDRNAPNWIRLDARGSQDRDGHIASYSYEVVEQASGHRHYGPGATSTRVAHVQLAPGLYEVLLRVVDDDGAVATDQRSLSIPGTPRSGFGRLGVAWALDEEWRPGDRFSVLKHAAGLVDLAEIGGIFASEPAAPPGARGLASTTSSSANNCGSSMSKAGFNTDIASGALIIASSGASVAIGPEAAFGVKNIGEATGEVGTALSAAGASASSSCMQQEIDNLADEVQFQGQQILQIQNQLNVTDTAFFSAWQQVQNTDQQFLADLWRQIFVSFSPTVTGSSSCTVATTDGPPASCGFTSPGLVGGFMAAAGLWGSDNGPAIDGLCNTPGPGTNAIPCTGSSLLQSKNNFQNLQIWADANSAAFQDDLEDLTGTTVTASACTGDVWKCLQYDGSSQLLITLEALYGQLLNRSGGSLATALVANRNSDTAELLNLVELIDAYNQTLTGYIQEARTALFEGFQMEWVVNNFNFYANLPSGAVPENGLTDGTVSQLGAVSATYFAGPGTSDSACTSTGQQCIPGLNGYACAADSPDGTAGAQCAPSSSSACGGQPNQCNYAYCGGTASQCAVDTSEMIGPYNAAQLELAYLYAARLNLLYELYLRFLVTDLPITGPEQKGLQAWPVFAGTRYCSLPASLVKQGGCANGACTPQACSADGDCASGTCLDPQVDYEAIVTSASFFEPGSSTSRETPFIGQPIGWIQQANANFDSSPYPVSSSSYEGGVECAGNAGEGVGDQVTSGQPGVLETDGYSCGSDFPWCVGYQYDVTWGECSNVVPWTATGALYQYALKDPYACGSAISAYNALTTDDPPNLAGAITSSASCPSVFASPGGQAPRYGYFDGLTLQPYTYEAGTVAAAAENACPAACSAPSLADEFQSEADMIAMPCTSYGVAVSLVNDNPVRTASFSAFAAPDCAQGSSPSCPASNTCTALVGLAGGSCPAFIGQGPSGQSYCVGTDWAQYTRTTPLTNCQACAQEPQLLLAGPMQGNVGACAAGSVGNPYSGPKMDWSTPTGMDVTGEANLALLCEGCVYLGCGNYAPLDTGTMPWTMDTPTGSDSLAQEYYLNGNCSSDGDGVPCTVASVVGGACHQLMMWDGPKDSSMMTSVMVNDYRCGYIAGYGASFIGISNDPGASANFNADAQSGSYPWGCGALGFNTETESGSAGSTNWASLLFENPNAMTNLWDAVVTSDAQQFAYTSDGAGYTFSGPQVGVQLVSQCATSCGATSPTSGGNTACLSIATPADASSMDALGYACLPDPGGRSMSCAMNDGRVFSLGVPYGPGGLMGPVSPNVYGIQGGLDFSQSNATCPAACERAIGDPNGLTFGGMALNENGECPGFASAYGYCGGLCYNQPEIGNNPSATQPTAVQAPIDCRSCNTSTSFGACAEGYVPYAANDQPGSSCCYTSSGEIFPYSSGAYGDLVIDRCPAGDDSHLCTDPPCGAEQPDGSYLGVPSAAGTDQCYPWGNTSMWPLWPFTY